MPEKKLQYVLLPSDGTTVPEDNQHQLQFFQALHAAAYTAARAHLVPTETGAAAITVVDSIGEHKAKLIEIAPEDLPAFRGSHPSLRVMPMVYYQKAVVRYQVMARPVADIELMGTRKLVGAKSKGAARGPGARSTVTFTVASAGDGKPVAGALVIAFTDFATRTGVQGTTGPKGKIVLDWNPAKKKIDCVCVYPKAGYWPLLRRTVAPAAANKLELLPIDTAYTDCVRHFYGRANLDKGRGVTVGVIDCGVAAKRPHLVLQGGQNTVPGESPKDYGDNGTDGHGTHVAGIVAARGKCPGVAPGVALRSYRVFGKGAESTSNYAMAKAIDAAVADKCDLINMSLGGGKPDPVVAEAIASAYRAGVVIFAANGNDNRKPVSFPAANPMCQAVSAMGRKDTIPPNSESEDSIAAPYGKDKKNFIASFSNIGSDTDLTGPGVGVISTVPGGYGVMSGTSMATPAETGAAARLLSQSAILAMPRDEKRSAAMVNAISHACRLLELGAKFEGKGMIS